MEFAIYRIYYDADGRKMGAFVDMLPSREEAEAHHAQGLPGEHEVVVLWTREIAEEEGGRWDTVVFLEDGTVEPGEAGREEVEK